jgi:hypothetical protein
MTDVYPNHVNERGLATAEAEDVKLRSARWNWQIPADGPPNLRRAEGWGAS